MKTAEKWDKAADDFQRTYKLGKNEYSAALLDFWQKNGMLRPGCRALDVGCGVGKYGAYMAELGCDVTLTDISPEMLSHASKNMAQFETPWQVALCDFNDISGDEPVFSAGFDFAISTMSPAIHDTDTVSRMSGMTKGWCFLSRFYQWSQPGRDELLRCLGIEPRHAMGDMAKDCAKLIQAVSRSGYVPRVKYVDYNWRDMRTPEEAAVSVLRSCAIEESEKLRQKALAAAKSLCGEDGYFADEVMTKVAWIYWYTAEGEENDAQAV